MKSKQIQELIFLVALAASICNCQTVEPWSNDLPKSPESLQSDEKKELEFDKYAVYEFLPVGSLHEISYSQYLIQTQDKKDSNNYYQLTSFRKTMSGVEPKVETWLNEMDSLQKYKAISAIVGFSGVVFRKDIGNDTLARVISFSGISSALILATLQTNLLSRSLDAYHNALKVRIFSRKKTMGRRDWGLNLSVEI